MDDPTISETGIIGTAELSNRSAGTTKTTATPQDGEQEMKEENEEDCHNCDARGDDSVDDTSKLSDAEIWESSVAASHERLLNSRSTTASIPSGLVVLDTDKTLRQSDVFSSKISYSRNHPGNVFYRSICEKYSHLVYELKHEDKQVCQQVFNVVTEDFNGRFLRQGPSGDVWRIMPKDAVLRKIGLALRQSAVKSGSHKPSASDVVSTRKKQSRSKPTARRGSSSNTRKAPQGKKRRTSEIVPVVYQAQAGSSYIHPHTLKIISEVCNASTTDVEEALTLMDSDMKSKTQQNEKESKEERLQRLQLRHRFYAAWNGDMTPVEFAKKLMEFWGGHLVETTPRNTVEKKAKTPRSTTTRRVNKAVTQDEQTEVSSLEAVKPRRIKTTSKVKLPESMTEEDIDGMNCSMTLEICRMYKHIGLICRETKKGRADQVRKLFAGKPKGYVHYFFPGANHDA